MLLAVRDDSGHPHRTRVYHHQHWVRITVPEGYRTHLQERRAFEFTRSLKLPAQVDPEKVKATFEAGVLTLRLGKRPAEKPRAISVKAAG